MNKSNVVFDRTYQTEDNKTAVNLQLLDNGTIVFKMYQGNFIHLVLAEARLMYDFKVDRDLNNKTITIHNHDVGMSKIYAYDILEGLRNRLNKEGV